MPMPYRIREALCTRKATIIPLVFFAVSEAI